MVVVGSPTKGFDRVKDPDSASSDSYRIQNNREGNKTGRIGLQINFSSCLTVLPAEISNPIAIGWYTAKFWEPLREDRRLPYRK